MEKAVAEFCDGYHALKMRGEEPVVSTSPKSRFYRETTVVIQITDGRYLAR